MSATTGLSREDLGHLNYLRRVLMQPADKWEGFYEPQSESMNFALRFQLAFAAYALAALGLQTPAYREPYVAALRAAVERMLDVRAWGYWRVPNRAEEPAASSGHVAMMLSPRRKAMPMVLPPPGDPIRQDNVQFSGHLSTMIGLYERAGGDDRFDREFTLYDPESGVSYTYTHSAVATRIHEQMVSNYFHGVACEPSCAYVPCNNHAMSSNTIHDAVHGTSFAEANKDWIAWVRKKLVLKGAAVRGLFGACFLRDVGIGAPVAFQFTDSWGLAFLQPFDRPLARKLYKTFRRRVSREGEDVYVGSAPLCDKMEISDRQLNTAFAQIAARGLGDAELADQLQSYAERHFEPTERDGERYYAAAPRTLHTTALLALGRVAGGDTMTRLFHAARPASGTPELSAVAAPDGTETAVGVSRAEYRAADKRLEIELLASDAGRDVLLHVANALKPAAVLLNDAPWDAWQPAGDTLAIRVPPLERARVTVVVA